MAGRVFTTPQTIPARQGEMFDMVSALQRQINTLNAGGGGGTQLITDFDGGGAADSGVVGYTFDGGAA